MSCELEYFKIAHLQPLKVLISLFDYFRLNHRHENNYVPFACYPEGIVSSQVFSQFLNSNSNKKEKKILWKYLLVQLVGGVIAVLRSVSNTLYFFPKPFNIFLLSEWLYLCSNLTRHNYNWPMHFTIQNGCISTWTSCSA